MPFVFDAYGTLFDVHAAIARHREAVGPDAEAFSVLWRTKQLEYTWTNTLAGRYADFWTLTGQALDFCLSRFPSVDRTLRAKLLDTYLTLDAYPDARAALRDLKGRGDKTGILSNGSPAMLEKAVQAAGIAGLLDALLSIDGLRMYKPRPEVYALVTQAFTCQPADVVFVSSNRWDIMGAGAYGFRTAWVNRTDMPDEYGAPAPTVVLSGLTGLAAHRW